MQYLLFWWFSSKIVVGSATLPILQLQFAKETFHKCIFSQFYRVWKVQEGSERVVVPIRPDFFFLLSQFLCPIHAVPVEFLTFSAVRILLNSGISAGFSCTPWSILLFWPRAHINASQTVIDELELLTWCKIGPQWRVRWLRGRMFYMWATAI